MLFSNPFMYQQDIDVPEIVVVGLSIFLFVEMTHYVFRNVCKTMLVVGLTSGYYIHTRMLNNSDNSSNFLRVALDNFRLPNF